MSLDQNLAENCTSLWRKTFFVVGLHLISGQKLHVVQITVKTCWSSPNFWMKTSLHFGIGGQVSAKR